LLNVPSLQTAPIRCRDGLGEGLGEGDGDGDGEGEGVLPTVMMTSFDATLVAQAFRAFTRA